MLADFLKTAVEMGANNLEFEYEGGNLLVTALRGQDGVGIGSLKSNSQECRRLIDEIASLKKRKRVEIAGVTWRIAVSEYESFGEWAWRLKLSGPTKGP